MEDNIQESDELTAGYDGIETVEPTPTPAEPTPPEDPPAPEPRYVQITEDEWNTLRTKVTAIDEIKAENKRQFDAAFGRLGGMQDVLKRLQSGAEAGQPVEITEDDVADIAKEYPELGALHLKTLQKVAAKLRGTGSPINSDQIGEMVKTTVSAERDNWKQSLREELRRELAEEALTDAHEDWKTVRETPEFKQWLEAMPEAERTKFLASMSPTYVAKQLTAFKESLVKKAAPPAPSPKSPDTRQRRIEAAVNPRGVGGHAAGTNEIDDMEAGYAS